MKGGGDAQYKIAYTSKDSDRLSIIELPKPERDRYVSQKVHLQFTIQLHIKKF